MKEQSKQHLVADLLERSAAPCDIRALREVASAAIKARAERALLGERAFRTRLKAAVHRAADADEDLVLALAEIGRLHQSPGGKSDQEWLVCLAADLLLRRLPASFQFGDGDQRRHAALAVALVGQHRPAVVTPALLAKAAWDEEKANNARAVWIQALLSQASIAGMFNALASAAAGNGSPPQNGRTGLTARREKEPGKNRCRRLRGLLQSVNDELSRVSSDDSADVLCSAFAGFVDGAFVGADEPRDYRISKDAVDELLATAFQLLRCQFRLGTEAAFYSALSGAGKWLPSGGWRRIVSQSESIRQLRNVLLDGLLLLLERGKPDPALLTAHLTLSPGMQSAEQELRAAARKSKQLPPALQAWLASGGKKSPPAVVGEFGESDDLSAAMAMIVVSRLRQRTDGSVEAMLDDIRFKAPIHAETIEALVGLVQDLAGRLEQLANRRHLRLFGVPGEIVDFSPHAYRLPEGTPAVRRVCVESPGVEKCGRAASKVVVPALVRTVA